MNPEIWIALGPLALLVVILHYMPLWQRRSLRFGVTVPEDFRKTTEAKQILRQYRIRVWTVGAVGALADYFVSTRSMVWLLPAAVLLLTFASIAAFALARNRTLPYSSAPDTKRSAPLIPNTEGLPGGAVMAVGPFGIMLAAALYLHANWQGIPERFPVHWNFAGVPNSWAERSWRSVYGPLLAGAVLNVLLLLMGEGILRFSPRARAANTVEWTARFRRVNLRLLMVITWGSALLLAWIALLPLMSSRTVVGLGWLAPIVLIGAVAPFVWQLIRLSREPGTGSDGTPDRAWKLGQFYYNPDDPALLVERRFGIGYTVNFGNRASWWFLGLLALPALVLILK